MSVALAGNAPATFEIKSANLPLVALRLKSTDLSALAAELARQYGDLPDFFDNEPLVIDLSALAANAGELDFPALIALLRQHRLAPLAFKGGGDKQAAAALAAGLVAAPDAVMARASAPSQPAPEPAAAPIEPEPPQAPVALPALVIDKPLRSGQQRLCARRRPDRAGGGQRFGAEVIADGNIHVYAPLARQVPLPGRVVMSTPASTALSLEPQLVSIAGIYRTTETRAGRRTCWGNATQVRLVPGLDGEKPHRSSLSAS
jgi:septum site-determining protein MinC